MRLRSLVLISGGVLAVLWTPIMLAQGPDLDAQGSTLTAVIRGPEDVIVRRTIVLDAGQSTITGGNIRYEWYVEGTREPISRTVEAVYTPELAGPIVFRLVIRSQVGEEERTSEAMHTVIVYNRKIVLIADSTIDEEELATYVRSATASNVFLKILQPDDVTIPLGTEDALFQRLSEERTAFLNADTIVVWTEGIVGLQALMRLSEEQEEVRQLLSNQTIVLLTNRNLATLARTSHGPFSALQPRRILITRSDTLPLLLTAESAEAFFTALEEEEIESLSVDKSELGLRPWNILSPLVNYMLTNGVSSQTVLLLLVLPVIATILTFLKQVIGITTFGLYTPSIIALSFLALGWTVGVIFLLAIIIVGYATRALMKRFRLLYIPKVAIILTVVTFSLLFLLAAGSSFGIRFSRDTVFILLIMSTLAESFLNLKTEEGWLAAVFGIGETILAALLCVFIVQSLFFQSILLAYPELILLTLVVNFFLGKWTGLRLVEVFRFREVFRHLQEE